MDWYRPGQAEGPAALPRFDTLAAIGAEMA